MTLKECTRLFEFCAERILGLDRWRVVWEVVVVVMPSRL